MPEVWPIGGGGFWMLPFLMAFPGQRGDVRKDFHTCQGDGGRDGYYGDWLPWGVRWENSHKVHLACVDFGYSAKIKVETMLLSSVLGRDLELGMNCSLLPLFFCKAKLRI